MKKPDTLFLSGGGVNCLAFLGSLQYLIEKDIINENLRIFNVIFFSKKIRYKIDRIIIIELT